MGAGCPNSTDLEHDSVYRGYALGDGVAKRVSDVPSTAPRDHVPSTAPRDHVAQYGSAYELSNLWGTYGIPQYLYTDGGPDFLLMRQDRRSVYQGSISGL